MKINILKHTLALIFIFIMALIIYTLGGYFIIRFRANSSFSPVVNTRTKALSEQLSRETDPLHIRKVIDEFSNATGLGTAIQVLDRGKYIEYRNYSYGNVATLLPFTYPLYRGDKLISKLVLRWNIGVFFTSKSNEQVVEVVLLWYCGLIVIVGALVFLYLRWKIFLPLVELEKIITNIERSKYAPEDTTYYASEWKEIGATLNRVSDKLRYTTSTVEMLFFISKILSSSVEVNEVLNFILNVLAGQYKDISCSLISMSEDGFLKIMIQRGFSPELGGDFIKNFRVKSGEGYCGRAYQKAESVVVNDVQKNDSSILVGTLAGDDVKSFIYIPLMVDSKCEGVLNVNSKEKDFFVPGKVETITTLAEYLALAMKNSRLYERINDLNRQLETAVSVTTMELMQTNSKLVQKAREMRALSDISAFAASRTNLKEIFTMIVDRVSELLSAQAVGFFLYSKDTDDLLPHSPFFGIKDPEFFKIHFKMDDVKMLGDAIRLNSKFIINDAKEASESIPILARIVTVYSLMAVPLRSGNKPVGVMALANKFGAPFTEDDLRVVSLIAERISGVIDNIRLYGEREGHFKELLTLHEISSAISSEPDPAKTISKIVSATVKEFSADLCAFLLYDETTRSLVTQPGAVSASGAEALNQRISVDTQDSQIVKAFKSDDAFLSPDAMIDPRTKGDTTNLLGVHSLILVPLKAENRVIGVLRIGKSEPNCYSKDDVNLATLIARQAAVIIENAYLYDSLKGATLELEKLNQVKNEFLSIVSHELKTPITAIKGFVKLILRGEVGSLNPQQEKFLQIADQSTDRLNILISDLLDIAKIETGKLKMNLAPVNMKQILEDVVRRFEGEASKKGIKIISENPENAKEVMADRERIDQVIDNLVSNAIKFTSDNGSVTLTTADKGDFIQFGVRDTGIGISKAEQQNIFEKFYQVESGTTRISQGVGLGLAIVRSIVEMHGGQVWVESELGKGSEFKFILPRAKTEFMDFRAE